MTQRKIEQQSMSVSAIVDLIMAFAGVGVYLMTDIHALFLDGAFSFIIFMSAITAVIVSKISRRKTSSYPDGLYFLEPLYAIIESFLTLVLLMSSLIITGIDAHNYFYNGVGKVMKIGPVLPYSLIMVVLCLGLSIFNKLQNKRINFVSTILTAESRADLVDGVLSLGTGVAVILLYFVDINGKFGFLHYTGDFFITIFLVAFSIKPPIMVLTNAFKELSSSTTEDEDLKGNIVTVLHSHLGSTAKGCDIDIFKVGMHIKIRISLNHDINNHDINKLVTKRHHILKELHSSYESVELLYMF